ncbi:MAG: pyridoxal-phosphate dependent enzyme [Candidatus Schekmanbacteria bacterium]|nr:pyridoxal-phosphate dependent enzyme [Candidatus Schekmanbacteria bacterium]
MTCKPPRPPAATARRDPELFRRFPALRSVLPFVPLADGLPTPIEAMSGVAHAWQVPGLFVKRDDLTSSLYGGNKVRKLEWILGRALAEGRGAVLTTGAWGSHHALSTALFARQIGLRATLVLIPQAPTAHVRDNYLADLGAGARILRCPQLAAIPIYQSMAMLRARRAGEGWPLVIPMGGSDATGVLGYVEAAFEIAAQIQAGAMPIPDYVYVAAGTCGSLAGLALGFQLASAEVPELARVTACGVRVVPAVVTNLRTTRALVTGAVNLLRRAGADLSPATTRAARLKMLGDQLGRGYGQPTPQAEGAQRDAQAHDGLTTELTYTAKALAGVRAFATASAAARAGVHLYVHTLNAASIAPLVAAGDPDRLPRELRRA